VQITIAATGHRPDKLGGWKAFETPEAWSKLGEFAKNEIERLGRPDHKKLGITGMAPGWDLAAGMGFMLLKIPYIAAIPFEGHADAYDPKTLTRVIYDLVLAGAADTVVTSPGGFENYKYQVRNRWMVDRATVMLALHDGTRGGTFNCVQYAREKHKPIVNAWSRWKAAALIP
jgi:uncharacterized phage-like protein YoqJ